MLKIIKKERVIIGRLLKKTRKIANANFLKITTPKYPVLRTEFSFSNCENSIS